MASKIKDMEPETITQAPVDISQAKADIFRQATIDLQTAQNRKKELHRIYMEEEKVPIYLSPQYRNEFGNVMPVTINGISIFFKVDGSTQYVPKTFADEITRRRLCVDNKLTRQDKMSQITDNYETSVGDIKLFQFKVYNVVNDFSGQLEKRLR